MGARATTNDLDDGVPATGRRWSDVFHRSRLSPYVFVVAAGAEGEVIEVVRGLGLPEPEFVHMFSNAHWAWPLLDGGIDRLSNQYLPRLPDGVRVYGHRPMRLLCYLLNLKPPTRPLKGERDVRSVDELLADLEQQRHRDRGELLEQAETAMADDTDALLGAVRSFFGDAAVDAFSAWSAAGFSLTEGAELRRGQIPLDEAREWRHLTSYEYGFFLASAADTVRGHAYGLDELRRWIHAGAHIHQALALLDAGRSLQEAEPYLRIGCLGDGINRFIDVGITPEQYAEFKKLGFDEWTVEAFAIAGIPLDEARIWRELGADSQTARLILETGGTLADVREKTAAGEDLKKYAEIRLAKSREHVKPVP